VKIHDTSFAHLSLSRAAAAAAHCFCVISSVVFIFLALSFYLSHTFLHIYAAPAESVLRTGVSFGCSLFAALFETVNRCLSASLSATANTLVKLSLYRLSGFDVRKHYVVAVILNCRP